MKALLQRIPLCLLCMAFVSAEPAGIDQSLEYVSPPTGSKFIRWHAKTGRTYFVQVSDANIPLAKWSWAPIIESKNNQTISYQVDGTASRGFFRLHYTDTPSPAGVTLEQWDADGDSLPNALELSLQANPLNSDTNGDGIPDGWAHAHGHLPTASIASGLFNGGPATNLQAYQQGVQANPNATPDDLDGDLVNNDVDADPEDFDVDWKPASVGGYAFIDIGWPDGVQPGGQNLINDFNDLGHVLLDRHVWRGGKWHPIPLEEAEGAEAVLGTGEVSYESIDNTGFRLTPSGGILHVGTWQASQPNPLGSVPFPNHIGHQTYDEATSTYGPFKSTLSTHGLMIDQGLVVLRPLGGDATGRIFADKTYTWSWEPEIWIYNANMQKTGALTLPENFNLNLQDSEVKRARVTPLGWLAYPAATPTPTGMNYRLVVWNPGGQIIADSENLPSGYTGFADLPHGKPALAYGYDSANGTVFLLNESGTAFKTAPTLGGKRIHTFAGDGTSMTSDGKMWINGELIPIRDLCTQYGELVDDGWSLQVHKANKHGAYLMEASKNEEFRHYLLLPVKVEDNVFATGVDAVSITADKLDIGYMDKHWIMAPSGNVPNGGACSNAMKFDIHLTPRTELEMSYPQGTQAHATSTPAPVPLGGTAAGECAWHGESATTTETPAINWKIGDAGQPKIEVELPVAVKTMKRRTVRVVVWPVNLPNAQEIFPSVGDRNNFEVELKAELDRIFAFQINAWFEVSVGLNKTFDYLDGTTGDTPPIPYTLSKGAKEKAMIAAYRNGTYDINVFLINNVVYTSDSSDPETWDALGSHYPADLPETEGRENCAIVNMSVYYTQSSDQKHTIAHEIGHLLVGIGHPDQYREEDPSSGGAAPLQSLPDDHRNRLMHSNSAIGKLLVKSEWDNAEVWLRDRINGDN